MSGKMRVLILGGNGMLGHKLWQTLAGRFDTYATFRQSAAAPLRLGLFDAKRALGHVSAQDFDSVVRALAVARPDVVVNCIGIVKQGAAASDPVASIAVNALFPHRLAELSRASGARLIHIGTDCVFSGRAGNYAESDTSDAEDLYGRTKFLGEVSAEGCVTIRTSMIGRELGGSHGLVEWFLGQEGKRVRGFRRAIFSGFTTGVLSEIIASIITEHPQLQGVWQIAADPVNKYELLSLVKRVYGLRVEIEPDEAFVCDRSLDGARFRRETGFVPPSWPEMIERMHTDTTPYEELRRINA
jgi:dTDP-4-dehydrorhamnose reductase